MTSTQIRTFVRKFKKSENGQALPVVSFMLLILMGMTGLVLDIGRAYYNYSELQAATNAAALAGAGELPESTATTTATSFSAVSGNKNAQANMPGVSMVSGYPMLKCLTTLKNQGMACVSPTNANAIQIKEQVTVPMYFLALLGHSSMTLTATATAAMRGASSTPYNVAIILDTTASMADKDNDSNCKSTRLSCALQGVQILLQNMSPCGASLSSCGAASNGDVSNPVDQVSIFTFPGLQSTTDAKAEYDCKSSTTPKIVPYTYPTLPVYQVVDFSSDYRTSDTSTSLSSSSNLVAAIGGKSNCTGMQAPGGEGTYYAGVIYAAQAALAANTKAGVQNVMIMLSDGDASASSSQMTSKNNTGTYPSVVDQCHQAVTAAAAAAAAGTQVYSVAYGAASSGCSTDKPAITPCQTMQEIASAPQYFYSDYTASQNSGSCISASQPTSSLNEIFTEIAGNFTVPRLISNDTN